MTEYNKNNPFPAKIKERTLLNGLGSTKKTFSITLDLKGSGIIYKPGDAVGIFPQNPVEEVEELLSLLKKTGKEEIVDPRTQHTHLLREHLLTKVNLLRITAPLLRHFDTIDDPEKRKHYSATHDLIDLMKEHPRAVIPIQELLSYLSPLLPRFYSIASSQYAVGDEMHLLVSTFTHTHGTKTRPGLGSHFLTTIASPRTSVPLYLLSTKAFVLPEEDATPIIMIGPGTGVAPFRAFLQERHHKGASGTNWLIFGERNCTHDFYYENEMRGFEKSGFLKLDLAFSRDQDEKFYVQDILRKKSSEVWSNLQKGAHIYICGDARHMAKDVALALHHVAEKEGSLSPEEAKAYIKSLRHEKRLLLDVY